MIEAFEPHFLCLLHLSLSLSKVKIEVTEEDQQHLEKVPSLATAVLYSSTIPPLAAQGTTSATIVVPSTGHLCFSLWSSKFFPLKMFLEGGTWGTIIPLLRGKLWLQATVDVVKMWVPRYPLRFC